MTDRLTASVCFATGLFCIGYFMMALFAALVR